MAVKKFEASYNNLAKCQDEFMNKATFNKEGEEKSEGRLRSLCQHRLSLVKSVQKALFLVADRTFLTNLDIRLDKIAQKAHFLDPTIAAGVTFVLVQMGLSTTKRGKTYPDIRVKSGLTHSLRGNGSDVLLLGKLRNGS